MYIDKVGGLTNPYMDGMDKLQLGEVKGSIGSKDQLREVSDQFASLLFEKMFQGLMTTTSLGGEASAADSTWHHMFHQEVASLAARDSSFSEIIYNYLLNSQGIKADEEE